MANTTERDRARRLRASARRFRSLVENSSDGTILLDRDSKVFYASPAMAGILGYDVDELIGFTMFRLVHPDDLPFVIEHWDAALAAESVPLLAELRYRHKDGSWRCLETLQADRLNDPAIRAVVVNYRDVTERRRAEDKQRRTDRQLEHSWRVNGLGQVAATLAHQFNNVLMGILPFAEIIRRLAGDDERISHAAEQISKSVFRGKRVTEEILRFKDADAPVLEIINMGEWLTSIEPDLRAVAGNGAIIIVVLPAESVFAPCDSAQMKQVITNLVINARDAMPGGGLITLSLNASSDSDIGFSDLPACVRFVRLIVSDEGSGIVPEIQDQVFDPLFTTKASGMGLGLAVALKIVTRHGGLIFVGNAPSGGAAFHILLPQAGDPIHPAVAT